MPKPDGAGKTKKNRNKLIEKIGGIGAFNDPKYKKALRKLVQTPQVIKDGSESDAMIEDAASHKETQINPDFVTGDGSFSVLLSEDLINAFSGVKESKKYSRLPTDGIWSSELKLDKNGKEFEECQKSYQDMIKSYKKLEKEKDNISAQEQYNYLKKKFEDNVEKVKNIEGEKGKSYWHSYNEKVRSATNGEGICFKDEIPYFEKWAKGIVVFKKNELNGFEESADFMGVYKKIYEQFYGYIQSFDSIDTIGNVLRNKKISLHHAAPYNNVIQLIPMDIHANVPHIGSAAALRDNANDLFKKNVEELAQSKTNSTLLQYMNKQSEEKR